VQAEERALPTNFGEIAHYHKRIATQNYLLAQLARNKGEEAEAEYHAQVALRYARAAQEQRIAMSRAPGCPIEAPRCRSWYEEPGQAAWRVAARQLRGWLAVSLRRLIARREVALQSLSLN
jgi:hypothetical protein